MIKKKFIIGEEWLYYKIYCGAKTADLLLTKQIKPLVIFLLQQNYIDKWFFIRYNDSDHHLRIRFHLSNLQHIGFIITQVKEVLSPLIENRSIHKIETATYNRELKRYGADTIVQAETLFFNDSMLILEALELIKDEDTLLKFVLKNTMDLLENCNLDDTQKLQFVKEQMEAFKVEFHVNKKSNKQLTEKYRNRKQEIEVFLENTTKQKEHKPLHQFLKNKNKRDKQVLGKILMSKNVSITNKMSSFVHMSINRSFRTKQRLYEMLCYDFLVRYYKTKIAKAKYLQ